MDAALRYIIVGTGGFGAYWVRTILPKLSELGKAVCVAAVDQHADRLTAAQQALNLPASQCFTDPFEAFERRRADFAIICVPPHHHERMVDMALTFDLHILSEGPIAETMDASLRIYRKVKAARRKMAVNMSPRFEQDKQTLDRLVRSRRYGRLNYLVCRFTENARRAPAWGRFRHEMNDPLLIEAAYYHLDILRMLAEDSAKTVFANTWNPPWGEYHGDSTALLTVEMNNGVHCVYEGAKASGSTLNGWGNEYIRAECEHGTLELDRRQLRLITGGAAEYPKVEDIPLVNQPSWGTLLLAEMFCDWLNGAIEPPTTLSDTIRYSALPFAAIESARTGKAVDVREFLNRHTEATREA